MSVSIEDVNKCFKKRVVMGILNVTPDSFYADSRKFDQDAVYDRVAEMCREGADIIDIGGYSSRPGADEVSVDEEIRRVSTGVEAVKKIAPDMLISLDTFRAEVAEMIIGKYGPCIINDISAGEQSADMISVASKWGVPFIAMHMRGTPKDMQSQTGYSDIVKEVVAYLKSRAELLERLGVKDIILDPGFGFAKTTEQNYQLLAGMESLKELGYPILAGVSRKSMIYKVLDKTPAESLAGTNALHWECLRNGANVLRVHDVAAAADIVKLFNYYSECN